MIWTRTPAFVPVEGVVVVAPVVAVARIGLGDLALHHLAEGQGCRRGAAADLGQIAAIGAQQGVEKARASSV
jgi:hypothetical protein